MISAVLIVTIAKYIILLLLLATTFKSNNSNSACNSYVCILRNKQQLYGWLSTEATETIMT